MVAEVKAAKFNYLEGAMAPLRSYASTMRVRASRVQHASVPHTLLPSTHTKAVIFI